MKSQLFLLALFAFIAFTAVFAQYPPEALADEVTSLPDATLFSRQFAGYIPIRNGTTQMFYWLVTAKNNPETAPIGIWTSGGPGCSGFIGMLTEMSAYQPVKENGKVSLKIRDVHWNENLNIIYIEQPDVGFTNVQNPPSEWTDDDIARRNAEFIYTFLKRFSNFKSNPFFISSESYGGHYIPTLANRLIKDINVGITDLNFKWSIVGNPLIYLPYRDFGYYKTLINRNIIPLYPTGQQYLDTCQPSLTSQPNPPKAPPSACYNLESQMDTYISRVDPYAMSFPRCVDESGKLRYATGDYGKHIASTIAKAQRSYRERTLADTEEIHNQLRESQRQDETYYSLLKQFNLHGSAEEYFPQHYQPCEEDYTTEYLNRKDVQAALHANLKRSRWSMCENINYSDFDFIASMLPVYAENSKLGPQVKQLLFTANDDTMCSTFEAQMALFNNYKTKTYWQDTVWEGQLVGHKSTFVEPQTLTAITILGGGHMAPATRPSQTKFVIEQFIAGKL